MKAFLSACLCLLCVLFLSVPSCTAAQEAVCGEHLTWSVDEKGTLTISGTGPMDSFAQGSTPWRNSSFRDVVLEEGVTSIGAFAFKNCFSIRSVHLPKTLEAIGDGAFEQCFRLKEITLPDSVRTLGSNPFRECTALQLVRLSEDHPFLRMENGVLFSKSDRRAVCALPGCELSECILPSGTEIVGDYAFLDCDLLRSITFPEGLSRIGRYAFSGCQALEAVDLPQSMKMVGDSAFSTCFSLKSVHARDGLESIGDSAFSYCWKLRDIDLPITLTFLGARPFTDCRELSTFHLSDQHPLLAFGNGILWSRPDRRMIFLAPGYDTETFSVPEGIEVIGEKAFLNGDAIRTLILPGSLHTLEAEALYGCQNITEIVFSPGLTRIGDEAFVELTLLREAHLPAGVTSLGDKAFLGCSSLQSVTLPESLQEIGSDIFLYTDTLNLACHVTEGSAAEAYCLENGLNTVLPGQSLPEPSVELPDAFALQYPDCRALGVLKEGAEAAYLVQRADGRKVLLCGAQQEDGAWMLTQSAPLPEEARVVLKWGETMLDLGSVPCTVRRYFGNTWGIDYTGLRNLYFGPDWIGFIAPKDLIFGRHPWADLTSIDWTSLKEDLSDAMDLLDVSSVVFTRPNATKGSVPLHTAPDPDSECIAELFDGIPLFREETAGEWTRVCLGHEAEGMWKLEGWIRTDELVFPESAHNIPFLQLTRFVFSEPFDPVTLWTPSGTSQLYGVNYDDENWFVIGEKTGEDGEFFLLYECYTRQTGFIRKEDLREPAG